MRGVPLTHRLNGDAPYRNVEPVAPKIGPCGRCQPSHTFSELLTSFSVPSHRAIRGEALGDKRVTDRPSHFLRKNGIRPQEGKGSGVS